MTHAHQQKPGEGNTDACFANGHTTAQAAVSTACGQPCKARICWLGGWAIAEADMLAIVSRLLPQAEHRVLTPTADSLAQLRRELTGARKTKTSNNDKNIEIIAGYSTGAFLLLRELEQLLPLFTPDNRLLLFAPFVDFRAESQLGGRVVTTRLKLLLRRLRNDPATAIADFYKQGGITLPPPAALPCPLPDLLWGIEQLAQTAIPSQTLDLLRNGTLLPRVEAWIGAEDALLDAEAIATLFAPGICRIAQNTSHDFAALLAAATAQGALLP